MAAHDLLGQVRLPRAWSSASVRGHEAAGRKRLHRDVDVPRRRRSCSSAGCLRSISFSVRSIPMAFATAAIISMSFWGVLNTLVLIVSSLTMALTVYYAQKEQSEYAGHLDPADDVLWRDVPRRQGLSSITTNTITVSSRSPAGIDSAKAACPSRRAMVTGREALL